MLIKTKLNCQKGKAAAPSMCQLHKENCKDSNQNFFGKASQNMFMVHIKIQSTSMASGNFQQFDFVWKCKTIDKQTY